VILVALIGLALAQSPAPAPPPPFAASSVAEIKAGLSKGVAPKEIEQAILDSKSTWRPKDFFELVDARAPEGVLRALAAKAAVFYDGTEKPLEDVAKEARAYQPSEKLTLTDADFVVLFEWFNDRKYERDAAVNAIGPAPKRNTGELDREFDLRQRAYDVAVAKARGPADGKIEAAVFTLDLSVAFDPWDSRTGCGRARLSAEVDKVDYFVFRETLGGLQNTAPVTIKSRTAESMKFTAEGHRRLEANSWPICMAQASYDALAAKGAKVTGTLQRAALTPDWKGTVEFVDKSGNRLPAQR
jgi:hypothetical protein